MKAMILAAGLGTRLRPITDNTPKALVRVNDIPLLQWAIQYLIKNGYSEIVVNVHHFADQILNFLEDHQNFGINILISDESDLLLDTGGGIKKAIPFFEGQPFLVFNTDIISRLDLKELYERHVASDALATLALMHRKSSRYLLFDQNLQLCGWKNEKTGQTKMCRPIEFYQELAFSGIHVIHPRIIDFMPADQVFSIIDVYLKAGASELVKGYLHNEIFWMDVGKIADLEKARNVLGQEPSDPFRI